jgi:hypothetical protein
LKNIFATVELDKNSVTEDFSVVQNEGKRTVKKENMELTALRREMEVIYDKSF